MCSSYRVPLLTPAAEAPLPPPVCHLTILAFHTGVKWLSTTCVSLGVKRFTVHAPSSRSFRATTSLQSICASAPTRTSTIATTPCNGPWLLRRRRRGRAAAVQDEGSAGEVWGGAACSVWCGFAAAAVDKGIEFYDGRSKREGRVRVGDGRCPQRSGKNSRN
uniref:Uncharacterized protein n=1 Tax=Hyaloperonospora arabidopsidis (strain Emoy2) TaxID=559515 RepID=M4BLB5_HYAAE